MTTSSLTEFCCASRTKIISGVTNSRGSWVVGRGYQVVGQKQSFFITNSGKLDENLSSLHKINALI